MLSGSVGSTAAPLIICSVLGVKPVRPKSLATRVVVAGTVSSVKTLMKVMYRKLTVTEKPLRSLRLANRVVVTDIIVLTIVVVVTGHTRQFIKVASYVLNSAPACLKTAVTTVSGVMLSRKVTTTPEKVMTRTQVVTKTDKTTTRSVVMILWATESNECVVLLVMLDTRIVNRLTVVVGSGALFRKKSSVRSFVFEDRVLQTMLKPAYDWVKTNIRMTCEMSR